MKKYVQLSIFYMVLGLIGGVFYREFTKLNGFEGVTTLKALHPHALVLGFFFFIAVLLVEKSFAVSQIKSFKAWLVTYNISLIYVLITMTIRGIYQVNGADMAGLNHIAGLAHALLGTSMVWFTLLLYKAVGKQEA